METGYAGPGDLRGPVGWGFAGPVAGLVEIGVGFLELGNGMGDPRRVGSSQAWVAVYGLRNVGLRALRFFVNLWKAAGAYGGVVRLHGEYGKCGCPDMACGLCACLAKNAGTAGT